MDMEDLYRLLRTGHVQAQGIVDTVADPLLVLDASLCIQAASRSFYEVFRVDRDTTIGQPLYALGDGQWDIPELRTLLEQVVPRATAVINYEVTRDFPDLGERTMLVTARTLQHSESTSRSMLVSIIDATDRRQREMAKDMLFGELRHRMKNLLAVAQSMARHTPTEGRTAEQYRDAFLSRFGALVEAQDLAFGEHQSVGLQELLDRVFAPFLPAKDAVLVEPGAAIELGPKLTMSLSLVLHELATNALKYGALSASGGQVRVGWRVAEDNRQLRLWWVESGGPVVTAPAVSGYGTKLISSTITYGLRGELEQDYAPGGFKTEIVIPLGGVAPLE